MFAEEDVISAWEGVRECDERWLLRRCGLEDGSARDEVGGRSLLELRFDCEAIWDVSLAYSSWGMTSWGGRLEVDGRLLGGCEVEAERWGGKPVAVPEVGGRERVDCDLDGTPYAWPRGEDG